MLLEALGLALNPKLKLMDQVREVLRVKHYSIRTERCYCDWIRRYVQYHVLQDDPIREAMAQAGVSKVEPFDGVAIAWFDSLEAMRKDNLASARRVRGPSNSAR